MADDNKSGSLASSGAVVAALAAMGLYYFHREAPLVDLRPADPISQEQAAPQTIDARLWQDPFAAVEKSRDKSEQRGLEKQCQQNPSGNNHCLAPLVEDGTETLILGVTVSGAPYQEDAEQRRRTRYAVLAGLERAGFVPRDARHIDFFLWRQDAQSQAPTPFAFDIPVALSPLFSWWKPALVLAPQTVASELPPILPSPLLGNHAGPNRNDTAAIGTPQPAVIPYERFAKLSEDRKGKQGVVVLWLKEEYLTGQPLHKLSWLIRSIIGQQSNIEIATHIKLIGPHSSDTLKDMVDEARKYDVSRFSELRNVQFYAYAASAPDRQLLNKANDTIRTYFQGLFDIRRTVATDDTLAYGIATELKRRHVDPGSNSMDHIALISEWDTVYGQTLPQAVQHQLAYRRTRPYWHHQTRGDVDPPWVHKFTYLRGLDGLLPSAGGREDRQQDKATTQGEKQTGATDFFKLETDSKSLERPLGQGQFDYLRRISEHLHQIDDKLRKGKPIGKIKAIGILGSDVFDKLLILRALRLEFPEALFFTTDFDEAFTIKSELPFTRNLIISSSFGPNLSDELQGDIPFFRDTYQTAAFLATRLAIGENWNTWDISPSQLTERLRVSQIFEIGRTGYVQQFKGKAAPISMLLLPSDDRQKECSKPSGSCNSVPIVADDGHALSEGRSKGEYDFQPRTEDLFPTFEESSRMFLAAGLAGGAFFGLALLYLRKVPEGAHVEVKLGVAGLGVGALTCAFWEPFAQFVTGNGNGESLAILEGVSVWPTVLLRIFGIILSFYFIWRAQLTLRKNLADIATDMGMDLEPKPASQDKRLLWKKITSIFDFSLGRDPGAKGFPLNVEAAWQAYIGQERLWPRFCRAAIYTLGMLFLGIFVLVPMFGMPTNPARSELAYYAYKYTTLTDVLLMQFLTFLVFDATCFCLFFVNKLRRAQTQWPQKTTEVYNKRLQLQTKLVHDWIDLDFVAKRTRCIGALIYFPFVLIALLIVSRSTMFANYAPSIAILISLGISLTVVFTCAFMLWLAAKAARDTAKQNLTDAVIRAKASDGDSRFAEQLETLLGRVDQLKDGAFSPFTQQPLVRALLFPLSSAGGIALIENGMFPGL